MAKLAAALILIVGMTFWNLNSTKMCVIASSGLRIVKAYGVGVGKLIPWSYLSVARKVVHQ